MTEKAITTYESIAFALVCHPVGDDNGLFDLPESIEVGFESLVCSVIRQTTHKQLGVRCIFSCESGHCKQPSLYKKQKKK